MPPTCSDRLLRQAQQKIGEVGAGRAEPRRAAGRIEAGEREAAARIAVDFDLRAIEPEVAADSQPVLRTRMDPRVAGGQPVVGSPGGRGAADAGESGERQVRHAPVDRIGRCRSGY